MGPRTWIGDRRGGAIALLALILLLTPLATGGAAPPEALANPRVSLIPPQKAEATQVQLKRTGLANHERPAAPGKPVAGPQPRRIVVADETGRRVVARVLGSREGRYVVLLPDGRLGWPDGLIDTARPFVPATADEMRRSLVEGGYQGFEIRQTEHYLVVSQATPAFAAASAQLLESLYRGLTNGLRCDGIAAQEAEIPLVAVIYRTEKDFRARHDVDPDVQAFYSVSSNRIFFYETSDRDQQAPEVAALRKPQTVAHEGTHQILQNIGVQPRLADWPAWLAEGLAEYCAPTTTGRNGDWARFGKVNPFHMATFRDLKDPAALQGRGQGMTIPDFGADPRHPMVEGLATRGDLTPTDYASSWALTHYLATRRLDQFLAYLKTLGRMRPLERRTPTEHLFTFRSAFGDDLAKLDRKVRAHVDHLEELGHFEALTYYAVIFEQVFPDSPNLRGTLVSQSPSVIRQWLDSMVAPHGGQALWEIIPCQTRGQALLRTRRWHTGP